MDINGISRDLLQQYEEYLTENEKAGATIEKYRMVMNEFALFLQERSLTKHEILSFRELLRDRHKPQTVNVKLAAVNSFLDFAGRTELKVRFLKIQRRAFVEESRELTDKDYRNLLEEARKQKNDRLYHIIITLSGTGIRISELQYITVEAVKCGRAEINMKGKHRLILLPQCLKSRLLSYIKSNDIKKGAIFRTRTGAAMDRSNIWHELKKLCQFSTVNPDKVFPHNFRHLFARCYYGVEKNLAHLADILGHSSVETTRTYVAVSAKVHEKTLCRMNLVI
nr:tyrosine-type recombinase/integrase [uncultured Eisenbergiella sp.]